MIPVVHTATSYPPLDIADGAALTNTDPSLGGIYSRLPGLGHDPLSMQNYPSTPDG
jgi:hypothetical protein